MQATYKRLIASITVFAVLGQGLVAQFDCTNCPLNVPDQTLVTSEIVVSGVNPSFLGPGGVEICEVRLHLETDAIREIDVELRTPSGETIKLIERTTGIGFNQNLIFDISYVSCNVAAAPDPGFPDQFDSQSFWPTFATYTGSYYPEDGQCLESFTGASNGVYRLTLEDFVGGDEHDLIDWEIIFCNAQASCNPGDLVSTTLSTSTFCEGDPQLLFTNITPVWNGNPPDPALYGITYYVGNNSLQLFDQSNTPDLTALPTGTYTICGLSYLLSDVALLPSPGGGLTYADIVDAIQNGVFCGDLVNSCSVITIEPDLPDPIIDWPSPAEICEGILYTFSFVNYDPSLTYTIATSSGSFNAFGQNANGDIIINAIAGIDINMCISTLGDCNSTPSCITLTVLPNAPAPVLDAPPGLCVGDDAMVSVTNAMPGDTYTWSITGPGSITANNNDNVTITGSSSGQVEVCAEVTNSCGTQQTCITLTVEDPAPPSTNALPSYCLPTNFFAGNANGGSTSILWEQVSGPGTITFFNNSIVATQWTADLPGIYVVRLTKESNGCVTFEESTIELLAAGVVPLLDGPLFVCPNTTSTISITNPQPGDTYTWSTVGPVSIVTNNTTSVDVAATGEGAIEVCVDYLNNCGSGTTCWQAVAYQPDPPTANADPTYCMPGGTFSGSLNGPSAVSTEYTQVSGPGTVTFSDPLSLTTVFTVDIPGTYVIELSKNYFGCDTSEIFTIDVIESPDVQTAVVCSGGNFTIELTFSGGTAPYTVFGTQLVGNVYTSPPYPGGSAVATPYQDANGCGDDIFVQEFCPCDTDAGSMDPTVIELCEATVSAAGTYNNDGTLDADDIGQYVLHTGAGTVLGTIISINSSGIFGFQAPMQSGVTYYISYIVGNDIGGNVDLTDQCLSVAVGQPVVWYLDPMVDIIILNDPIACDQSLVLEAQYSLPTGINTLADWSTTAAPPGGVAMLSSTSDQVVTATFTVPGAYTLRHEVTLGPCTYFDELTLTIDEAFTVTSMVPVCIGDGTYTVTIDLTGGTPPYTIDGTTIVGSSFTSAPITIGQPYSFIAAESGGCPVETVAGSDACPCISDAGTMDSTPLVLCSTATSGTSTTNGDAILDGSDGATYYLHTGSGTSLGTIIQEDPTGNFAFVAGMIEGQLYYISLVVGNVGTTSTIDLSDPCLSVSQGTPISWQSTPIITMPPGFATCDNPTTINIVVNQAATVAWSISSGPPAGGGSIDATDPLSIAFATTMAGIYTLEATATSSAGCVSSETITIEIYPPVSINGLVEECFGSTYVVTFDIIDGTAPYTVDGMPIVGTTFTSVDIPSGLDYNYIVEDANGCFLDNVTGTRNCDCDTDAGSMSANVLQVCSGAVVQAMSNQDGTLDTDDIGIYYLHTSANTTLGLVFDSNATGIFTNNPGMSTGVTYYISYVVGNDDGSGAIDLNDPCLDVAVGQPVIWLPLPAINYNDVYGSCSDTLFFNPDTSIAALVTTLDILSGPGIIVDEVAVGSQIGYVFSTRGQYVIEITSDLGGCMSKDTSIFDLSTAIAVQADIACDSTSAVYDATIVVTGGTGPYTIGSSVFTDTLQLQGFSLDSALLVTATDTNGCVSSPTLIEANCGCIPINLSLDARLVIACGTSDTIMIDTSFLEQLPQGYSAQVLVHNGSTDSIGTVITTVTNGTLVWNTTLGLDTIYYVTIAAVNSAADSTCISYSNGQPISFITPPQLPVLRDTIICGTSFELPRFADGELIEYNLLNPSFTAIPSATSVTVSGPPGATTVVTAELGDGLCQDSTAFTVTGGTIVLVESIETICDTIDQTFDLQLVVTGTAPFTLNGVDYPSDTITITEIPANIFFDYILTDATGCSVITTAILVDCGCPASAGDLEPELLQICEGDDLVVNYINTPTIPSGYADAFIVTTNPDNLVQGFLSSYINDTIKYQASFPSLDTLWIVPLVGAVNDSLGGITLMGTCTVAGQAQPIIFLPEVSLSTDAVSSACAGDTVRISIATSTPTIYPQDILITIGADTTTITIEEDLPLEIAVVIATDDVVVSAQLVNYPCTSTPLVATIQVEDCDCILYEIAEIPTLCNDNTSIDLNEYINNGYSALWTVTAGAATVDQGRFLLIDAGYSGPLVLQATPLAIETCDTVYTVETLIEWGAPIQLSSNKASYCLGDDTILDLSTVVISPDNGVWTPLSTLPQSAIDGSSIDITQLTAGSYVLAYTNSTSAVCPSDTALFTITKYQKPDYLISSINPDCLEELGSIAISIDDPATIIAITLDGSTIDDLSIDNLPGGIYDIQLTDANACIYSEQSIIQAVTPINVDLEASININEGTSYTVRSNVSSEVVTYLWTVGNDTIDESTASITITIEQDTEIYVLVTDENGCIAEDFIILRFINEPIPWVVSNIINPQSATNNSLSIPDNSAIRRVIQWSIYDRWGNLIFSASDYSPRQQQLSWDGRYNGQIVESGVYAWYLLYEDETGSNRQRAGDVTVLR